jgi:hypothetical protein
MRSKISPSYALTSLVRVCWNRLMLLLDFLLLDFLPFTWRVLIINGAVRYDSPSGFSILMMKGR